MRKWSMCVVLSMITAMLFGAESISRIRTNFCCIPDSQKLAVYWYWIAGNMSKEGVVKDLQAMKKVGINRVQIGMIGEGQGTPTGPVKALSDEWWKILHQALKTAGDLNIEVGLFNCPGWSQSGGHWVKADQAMRFLEIVKDTVDGGKGMTLNTTPDNKEARLVKVLAYPLVRGNAVFTSSEDMAKTNEIHFRSSKKAVVRSLILHPAHESGISKAELFVETPHGCRSISKFEIDRRNPSLQVGFDLYAPVAVSVPEIEGTDFKLVLERKGAVVSAKLSDVPVVESYAEKTFAKMWQTPHPMWDAYLWRSQPEYPTDMMVQPSQVVDITDKIDANGCLHWTAPKGEYVILQARMVPTGITNSPAPKDITGYETDKMSKEHIRAHFNNYLGKILERIPASDRKTFKIVVEDSYETGGQNWTDNMVEDFKKAYGYDPVPFIPVFSGVVVGSEDLSDRFLWDVRRLIADEVSYNYVGGLREISHEHGLTTWLENYGHWGFPGEFLQYGGQSDEIAGEFWSFGTLGDIENRVASSCGHIYGKDKIWAESFTCGGPDFSQYPGQMKQRGDRFFAEGINSTLLHLYIQQPADDVPGINAWFGNEFNRNNTWFSQMDVFGKYLKRCNYMLQQGTYVADVAYFIGEDAPKMTGIRTPEIPQGYSYDYVNAEVLMSSSVKDGKLRLKSGMEYRVLVLPQMRTMRPELLGKIVELVGAGLTILGPAPEKSPSLKDYPKADLTVKEMADKLWQLSNRPFAQKTAYGKGFVYKDASLEQVLADGNEIPDFVTNQADLPVLFLHRHLEDAEIYFISNQSDRPVKFDGAFRVVGMRPELWNPLEANIRFLPEYTMQGRQTHIPIELDGYESAFVVFRKNSENEVTGANYPEGKLLLSIDQPWKVSFQTGRGGPQEPVTFKALTDWTENENPAIKYFSGTAVYKNQFKISKIPQQPVYIEFGKVMVMAKVRINGKEAGGLWTPPYKLEVSSLLKKGNNEIEVEVVNCWRNRIIGEKKKAVASPFTKQSTSYLKADTELQPSGLTGEVKLKLYDYKFAR